jgi:hypothetical protein
MIVDYEIPDSNVGMERSCRVNSQQVCAENIKNTYVSSVSTTSGIKIVIVPTNSGGKTTSLHIRNFSHEYQQLLDTLPWAAGFFGTASELTNVKSLLPYYKEISDLIANKEFESCDDFLGQVRAAELSDVLLVGLLRLTKTWRSELPSWNGLLVQSRKDIENRGKESDVLLKGLT